MDMDYKEIKSLVECAKQGENTSTEKLIEMFKRYIIKNSYKNGVFDEDLFQELNIKFLNCIKSFKYNYDTDVARYFS
jgi:DNA-directed RNA polymerase specialized sigma subunit